ncbi:TlpA disulfide reductase family protein [Planctomycetota bacterium]|nr:TlpA disulfide reductase family protein [Planctomycetota bacterium]
MIRSTLVCLTLAIAPVMISSIAAAQDTEKQEVFATYDELFDSFDKRRQVLITKLDALRERENATPAEAEELQDGLIALDTEYAGTLKIYVDANPKAKDLMPARFERAVTLSRIESKLAESVLAIDEFLNHHTDSELAADARYVKAQTLFRISGREQDALKALDTFLEAHKDRREADSIRMMRVRTLLFLDRVDDAKKELDSIAKLSSVKKDDAATQFIETQRSALDWVGTELPEFSVKATDGSAVNNASIKGKPTLLFFWDSTSESCLGELSFVRSIQKSHGPNLNVIGVSINESKTAFEQWLKRQKDKPEFTNVWIDRAETSSLLKKLDVSLIPFSVLVGADGTIYRYDVRSDDLLRYAPKLVKAE